MFRKIAKTSYFTVLNFYSNRILKLNSLQNDAFADNNLSYIGFTCVSRRIQSPISREFFAGYPCQSEPEITETSSNPHYLKNLVG